MVGEKEMRKDYIILLDIDGVLAPYMSVDEEFDIIPNSYGYWQIPTRLIKFLKKLDQLSNVVWLSAWQRESNMINHFLNIEEFPVSSELYNSKKMNIVNVKKDEIEKIKMANPDAIIISIDDDFEYSDADYHFQPNRDIGLTDEEIEAILYILEG